MPACVVYTLNASEGSHKKGAAHSFAAPAAKDVNEFLEGCMPLCVCF